MNFLKTMRIYTTPKRRLKLFTFILVIGIFFIFYTGLILPTVMRPTIKRKIHIESGIRLDLRLDNYLQQNAQPVPFHQHYFDANISNKTPHDRYLNDTRHQMCIDQEYAMQMHHTTSVIISFYNEARSTLLRTVISILNRTPEDLLQEIILVDDFSDSEDDGLLLGAIIPKVKVLRNQKREGLIRSRNRGARESTGSYIFFIDSHCEVNVGWLEPLMSRITHNPGVVASPIIDVISPHTFDYKASSSRLKGGFDWSLAFKWIPMSEEERESRPDEYMPFLSPSTSGGVFLISKQWFDMLGGFDEGMNIWGGESLEISIKAWLCGGQIEVVPCSRVGHIFRKKHPFDFPNGLTVTKMSNYKRIAEVWLDEFKNFFYSEQPDARKLNVEDGLEKNRENRERLQCRKFNWFLQNVFQELKPPNDNHLAFGELKQGERCLVITSKGLNMNICFESRDLTKWSLHRDTGLLRIESGGCLNVDKTNEVVVQYCREQDETQRWRRNGGTLIHNTSGRCLESLTRNSVGMSRCRLGAPSQLWNFAFEFEQL